VSSESESQLISQAITGDMDAFSMLVVLYQQPLYNLTYRMLGDSAEAEDAAQETFIRAFTNLDQYDPSRSFKTWVFSIASNHCIDRLRKRRLTWLSIDENENEGLLPHPSLVSHDPTPEQSAILHEQSELIQNLLSELAPDYRAVVILRYWYDMSYLEIAEAMNTTESAIKSRLFRARQMLADKVGTQGLGAGLERLMAT
jgi:RNA polymerase sigma-70 factor (ECF subfamily)